MGRMNDQPALAHLMRRFSVAPMMDWTDRHCRVFHRILSARSLLYTEMVTADAVIHGDRDRLLGFDAREHPVAVQLGGSDPQKLTEATRICTDWGYDEINLNVGCPSDRVQSGRFGACLMREPQLVADCLAAMVAATDRPVTIKHRLGVDDDDPHQTLFPFLEVVKTSGVASFTIHARKAILQGLSPKDNRTIPPLDYDLVYAAKRTFPDLEIIVNGGVQTLAETQGHLQHVDGVMMGRAAYQTPAVLLGVDAEIFGEARATSRHQALAEYQEYMEAQLQAGVSLPLLLKPVLGVFHGQKGGRLFRREIAETAHKPGAGPEVLSRALAHVATSKLPPETIS